LECMAEHQVTVDGVTRPVPRPFQVFATQNPIEFEGTFPLPEAQVDRFLIKMSIGYPSAADEGQMLVRLQMRHPIETVEPVSSREEVLELQAQVRRVFVHASVRDYVVRLIQASRSHPDLALGASPRGSIALFRTAQAVAAMDGLDFVLPEHVKDMLPGVLAHRIILRPEVALQGRTVAEVIEQIDRSVHAPVGEKWDGGRRT